GRMDYCFYVPTPNAEERVRLLDLYSKGVLNADVNALAEATAFYSCADLKTLCHKAKLKAVLSGKTEAGFPEFESVVRENPSTAVQWLEDASKMQFTAQTKARFRELWDQVEAYKTKPGVGARWDAAVA
ncbi:MAG: hypothetical protein Q8P02_05545, partial [Candidatus Micrarchaeota archaeon]|nr:hypothetical protein [Candidatus Micrarchaeota archaeon]